MGPEGFAEFHRGFLVEFDRDALIVDVRVNGGGHVSSLLLEKLARKRVGYDFPRWAAPQAYPDESPAGPLVCAHERAGWLGRRHLQPYLQAAEARAAGREAHLGRRDRHLAAAPARGWHGYDTTGVFVLLRRRRLGGRELRDRPGRRGGQRAAGLRARRRPPARTRHRARAASCSTSTLRTVRAWSSARGCPAQLPSSARRSTHGAARRATH